jgi:hypothetical protein
MTAKNKAIETLKISLNVELNIPYKTNINSTAFLLNVRSTLKKAVYLYALYIRGV